MPEPLLSTQGRALYPLGVAGGAEGDTSAGSAVSQVPSCLFLSISGILFSTLPGSLVSPSGPCWSCVVA